MSEAGDTPVTRLMQIVLVVQGVYYSLTGLWPLVSIDTFQSVTGPKTDLWLVRMVGVLAAVIGGTLLVAVFRRRTSAEVCVLAVGSALGFGTVDVVYAGIGRISPVYFGDAAVEIALAATLVSAILVARRNS
jgi:hypothetical protein